MKLPYGDEYVCDHCGQPWFGAELIDASGKDWCGECVNNNNNKDTNDEMRKL